MGGGVNSGVVGEGVDSRDGMGDSGNSVAGVSGEVDSGASVDEGAGTGGVDTITSGAVSGNTPGIAVSDSQTPQPIMARAITATTGDHSLICRHSTPPAHRASRLIRGVRRFNRRSLNSGEAVSGLYTAFSNPLIFSSWLFIGYLYIVSRLSYYNPSPKSARTACKALRPRVNSPSTDLTERRIIWLISRTDISSTYLNISAWR